MGFSSASHGAFSQERGFSMFIKVHSKLTVKQTLAWKSKPGTQLQISPKKLASHFLQISCIFKIKIIPALPMLKQLSGSEERISSNAILYWTCVRNQLDSYLIYKKPCEVDMAGFFTLIWSLLQLSLLCLFLHINKTSFL